MRCKIMLSVIMLSVDMLSVDKLSVVMPNDVMLSVSVSYQSYTDKCAWPSLLRNDTFTTVIFFKRLILLKRRFEIFGGRGRGREKEK